VCYHHRRYGRDWTPDELQFLELNWYRKGCKECASLLGRNEVQVLRVATKKLHLRDPEKLIDAAAKRIMQFESRRRR
jgi:hypothetical protein